MAKKDERLWLQLPIQPPIQPGLITGQQTPAGGPRIRPNTGYTPRQPTRSPSSDVTPMAAQGPQQPVQLPRQGIAQIDAYTGADRRQPPRGGFVDPRTEALRRFTGNAPPGGDPALNALRNLPAPGLLSEQFYRNTQSSYQDPRDYQAGIAPNYPQSLLPSQGSGESLLPSQGPGGAQPTQNIPVGNINTPSPQAQGAVPQDMAASGLLGFTPQQADLNLNAGSPQPTQTLGVNYAGRYGNTDVFSAPGEFQGQPVTRFSDYANLGTLSGGPPAPIPGRGQAGYGNSAIGGQGNNVGGTPDFAQRGAQSLQALQGNGLLPAQSVTGQDMTLANRYLNAANQYRQAREAMRPAQQQQAPIPGAARDGGGYGILSNAYEANRRARMDAGEVPGRRRAQAYEAALAGHREALGLPSAEERIAEGNQALTARGQNLDYQQGLLGTQAALANQQAQQAYQQQQLGLQGQRLDLDRQRAAEEAYQGRYGLMQGGLTQLEPPPFADLYGSIGGNPFVGEDGKPLPLAQAYEQYKSIFGNTGSNVAIGGKQYSMDDVISTAAKYGMTPEEFLSRYGAK